MTAPGGGLVVANLDFEAELAGRKLSVGALRTISHLATLLRALAAPDDELWTPSPVEPGCMAVVPGLPWPRLRSGPLPLAAEGGVIAWAETESVSRLRRGALAIPGSPKEHQDLSGGARRSSLVDLLTRGGRGTAEASRRAAHRAEQLELARELGCVLEGAMAISTPAELERHLARGGGQASPSGRWVLKAAFSASGRERVHGRGNRLEGDTLRQVENLLESSPEGAVLEPWMDRVADLGSGGVVEEDGGILVLAPHQLEVDARGRFRGVRLGPEELTRLEPAERAALDHVVRGTGAWLHHLGFRGPFGIDSWIHRDASGRRVFQALGEVNPRLTLGLVARALVERILGAEEGKPTPPPVRLVLGRHQPSGPLKPSAAPRTVLLEAACAGDPLAWLEWGEPPRT